MTLVLVMVGGAVGATARFLVDRAVTARWGRTLPWGTLAVNVAGSLLLGLLAGSGSALPGSLGWLLGTGFCGAFTTYSTFGYETVRLAGQGGSGAARALLNVTVTVAAGLTSAALGWQLTSSLAV
ncbi:fluoride efflux transporter CrcB [Micromonospora sp. NPDC049679]|uniref:fluoride efflux transporter CrcB n=1 Tax=Micromonospora sp. NPDC049679 TaxID=3155920 RepID=UPI0033C7CEBA